MHFGARGGLLRHDRQALHVALRQHIAGNVRKVQREAARHIELMVGAFTQRAEHHPEIDTFVHVMMVVDYAASQNYALDVRFAALTHDLGKGTTPREEWPRHTAHEARSVDLVAALCERLRVPSDCKPSGRCKQRVRTRRCIRCCARSARLMA